MLMESVPKARRGRKIPSINFTAREQGANPYLLTPIALQPRGEKISRDVNKQISECNQVLGYFLEERGLHRVTTIVVRERENESMGLEHLRDVSFTFPG